MRFNEDVIELDGLNFDRDLASRWQAISSRMRTTTVVKDQEFTDQMIEMMLAKNYEFRQATFRLFRAPHLLVFEANLPPITVLLVFAVDAV